MKNFYLDQINPLRGLDQREVVRLIELGQLGYYARLQWMYRAIEKSDPLVRAVKRRLLSSLTGLDWNIKQADVGEDAAQQEAAQKQADTLRAAYEGIENLRGALQFLALADLRGFAHLEKIYRGANAERPTPNAERPTGESYPWDVVELRPVEQWFWARTGFYAPWLYNADAAERNTGVPIDPAHFVIHQVDDPADEIFAKLAVKRGVNDSDWDGFLEDYGVPAQFIIMPPNVPKEREAEYQRAAELAISAARGALPHGSDLKSPTATGSGGAGVFSERLKYLDEQIVIAGTAGKLTILSEGGSGTLAGGAQKEAFDEIAQAIANQVATTLHAQFDQPLLARLHPGEPVLAYFEFAQINTKDTSEIFDDAVKAKNAGYRMSAEELSEKTGYELTDAPVVGPVSSPGGGKNAERPTPAAAAPEKEGLPAVALAEAGDPEQLNELAANSERMIAEAQAADLVPLRRALETAIANPTPERLQALIDSLPDVQQQLGTSEADARKNALGTALVSGLTS